MIRWLLPVASIKGEAETATLAACEWLVSKHALNNTSGPSSPQHGQPSGSFRHHSFPFHAFVPAYLSLNTTPASMSMSNQRHFWGIIEQFQAIWQNYRMTGWVRGEIFSMFSVEEEPSDSDEYESDVDSMDIFFNLA